MFGDRLSRRRYVVCGLFLAGRVARILSYINVLRWHVSLRLGLHVPLRRGGAGQGCLLSEWNEFKQPRILLPFFRLKKEDAVGNGQRKEQI